MRKVIVNLLLTCVAIIVLPLYIIGAIVLSVGCMLMGVFCAFAKFVEVVKDIWCGKFTFTEFLGE